MNTESMTLDQEMGAAGLGLTLGEAPVVLFRSRLTDVRRLTAWLQEHGVDYDEIMMDMGSSGERERYHRLERLTGWPSLPQVFIQGEFVGGEAEFFAHGFTERFTIGASHGIGPATSAAPTPRLMRVLKALGYAGVVPFAAGLLAEVFLADGVLLEQLRLMLLAYGAVILSFLGAVHWGRLLERPVPTAEGIELAIYGVTPSILAWLTLSLPVGPALLVQVLLFITVYVTDRVMLQHSPAAKWYLPLRTRLTLSVTICLLATWLMLLLK